jgi:arylsulfatase A-like enzyme
MTPGRKFWHVGLPALVLLAAVMVGLLALGPAPSSPRPGNEAPVTWRPAQTGSPVIDHAATSVEPVRPNIVLFTTDDQTVYEVAWMPKLRRQLGERGRTYRRALSPHPLCCPARAELLSGQYAQNNGIQHNHGPWGRHELLDSTTTIATWLNAAGYNTAFHGKYLSGYRATDPRPPGWTFWDPIVAGVYDYWTFTLRNNDAPLRYQDRYLTDVLARRTEASVRRFSAAHQPFFIWSSHVAPHGRAVDGGFEPPPGAPRHEGLFQNTRPPSFDWPSFNEKNIADQPSAIASRPLVSPRRAAAEFRGRLRSLQAVDDAVASLVRTLRETGQLDHTWIFFTSDNAMALGEHRYLGKNFLNREQLEIPLLVRGPGVPAGSWSGLRVTLVDLPATMARIAGVTPTRVQDGHSFLPDVHGHRLTWRDTQLIQAGTEVTGSQGWAFRGVLAGRYSFGRDMRTGERFLYDHRVDPFEIVNRVHRPAYRAVVAELAERLRALMSCVGTACHQRFGTVPGPRSP